MNWYWWVLTHIGSFVFGAVLVTYVLEELGKIADEMRDNSTRND